MKSESRFKILNPGIKSVLETIDTFRAIHKLENVHIFLTSSKEHHEFSFHQEKDHIFVKTIGFTKQLNEHLIFYEHYATSNKTNGKHGLNEKQLLYSFNQIKFLLKADDLIVIKCEQKAFGHFLLGFKSLINDFNKKSSSIHAIRHLIWIPETDSTKSKPTDSKLTSLISNVNQICSSLKIYLLNWYFPLDTSLNKIIDHHYEDNNDHDDLTLGRFSLKLLTSFKYDSSLKNVECSKQSSHSESLVFRQSEEIHADNHYGQPKYHSKVKHRGRPMYRIVSNPIEPFVITSQLDEDYISRNECKDGLLCLDIKSNSILDDEDAFGAESDVNNLTQAIRGVLNRELTIGLIKGFKYISDFRNDNEDKIRLNEKKLVKYKCCTGYVTFFFNKAR